MYYAIISQDIADSLALRQQNRPAHIARLNSLRDQGRLLLAGPFPAIDCTEPGEAGFTGSLVIAEFSSLQAAREWADQDPYLLGGVYERVDVRPYKVVLP